MKKAILAGIIVSGLLAPRVGYTEPVALTLAQSAPASTVLAQSPLALPENKTEQVFVIRPAQILAIGAGVVSGAVIVEALFSTDLGYLIGGAVGGYLANLWYGDRQLEIHLGTPPKI